MSGDDDEIRALGSALRAHAAWEAELSGGGWPEVAAPVVARSSAGAPVARAAAPVANAIPQGPIVVPEGERTVVLAALAEQAATCTRCELHAGRMRSVFSRGNPSAELVFVGEGPSAEEEQRGEPFVGAAGQLLDKMIAAMGFSRDAIYICHAVKCRPAERRFATFAEVAACEPFLTAQLEALRPKVIVALGRAAGQALGCYAADSTAWRGVWAEWRGVPVMPTHGPAEVLRTAALKRPVWEDLQAVMAKLGVSR
jgi:DNA polymerase